MGKGPRNLGGNHPGWVVEQAVDNLVHSATTALPWQNPRKDKPVGSFDPSAPVAASLGGLSDLGNKLGQGVFAILCRRVPHAGDAVTVRLHPCLTAERVEASPQECGFPSVGAKASVSDPLIPLELG